MVIDAVEGITEQDAKIAGIAHDRGKGGAVQYLCAQLCALLYQCLAVLLQRYRLLAEHSLTGARRVHQHPVEKLRQRLGNAGGSLVEHHGVGNAHALKVAF